MPLDHSLTYKKRNLINILHKGRLRTILKILDQEIDVSFDAYVDIGCSNGYLTDLIAKRYNFNAVKGIDHDHENLALAKNRYPKYTFDWIDLNKVPQANSLKFDLICCFETLEHVGDLSQAVTQIISFSKPGKSLILITVPIEIGFIGMVKFLVKRIKGYPLTELKKETTYFSYFWALLRNKNISCFRDQKNGWGTHFGFDYRVLDALLNEKGYSFKAKNRGSTRFYLLKNPIFDGNSKRD